MLNNGSGRANLLQSRARNLLATSTLAIVWIAALCFGLRNLLSYESTPGPAGAVPQSWPRSQIQRANDRPTLVMLAHPRCPCTRGSMGELAKIMAVVPGKVTAYVLFFTPRRSGPDWDDTDLRRSAAAIPGVTVFSDINGEEAKRFGAETSGQTLLFDAGGRLLFSGGITASRGHAGGNDGESAIVSLISHRGVARTRTFVFGCSLAGGKQMTKGAKCFP